MNPMLIALGLAACNKTTDDTIPVPSDTDVDTGGDTAGDTTVDTGIVDTGEKTDPDLNTDHVVLTLANKNALEQLCAGNTAAFLGSDNLCETLGQDTGSSDLSYNEGLAMIGSGFSSATQYELNEFGHAQLTVLGSAAEFDYGDAGVYKLAYIAILAGHQNVNAPAIGDLPGFHQGTEVSCDLEINEPYICIGALHFTDPNGVVPDIYSSVVKGMNSDPQLNAIIDADVNEHVAATYQDVPTYVDFPAEDDISTSQSKMSDVVDTLFNVYDPTFNASVTEQITVENGAILE